MNSKVSKALKIVLPIGFGIYLIWYVFNLLSEEEKSELFDAIQQTNYWWIGGSVCLGILSHISRAYRWKYLLEPLGYYPKFANTFFAVMIGYIVNLALPRAGELSRCGALSKYEKLPFNKLLGTVIAERIADMIILGSLIVIVIVSQFSILGDVVKSWIPKDEDPSYYLLIAIMVMCCLSIIVLIAYKYFKKSNSELSNKIKDLIKGLTDGIKSIIKMKRRKEFILHTAFIWLMYISMFYLCFFSLPDTTNVPYSGILAGFVMGGLSIIFVQGGIGVYPAAIMEVLMLYGIARPAGLAMGWIIWTSQTAMILSIGIFSLLAMPRYNKLRNNIN